MCFPSILPIVSFSIPFAIICSHTYFRASIVSLSLVFPALDIFALFTPNLKRAS